MRPEHFSPAGAPQNQPAPPRPRSSPAGTGSRARRTPSRSEKPARTPRRGRGRRHRGPVDGTRLRPAPGRTGWPRDLCRARRDTSAARVLDGRACLAAAPGMPERASRSALAKAQHARDLCPARLLGLVIRAREGPESAPDLRRNGGAARWPRPRGARSPGRTERARESVRRWGVAGPGKGRLCLHAYAGECRGPSWPWPGQADRAIRPTSASAGSGGGRSWAPGPFGARGGRGDRSRG